MFLAVVVTWVGVRALLAASSEFFPIDLGLWGFDPTSLAICRENGGLDVDYLLLVRPHCTNQTHFPPGYLGMAYLLDVLKPRGIEPATALAVINAAVVSAAAAVPLFFQPIGRALTIAALYVVIIWATPLPRFYVNSAALEVHHGVFLGMLVACSVYAVRRFPATGWPLTLTTNLLVALVLLYKDPTLVHLGAALALVVAHPKARALPMRESLAVAGRLWLPGALVGTAGQAAYNWIRYGSLLPSAYLTDAREMAPTIAHRFEQFVWAVLSPNGGIIVFWGLGAAVLAAGCALLRLRPSGVAVWYSLTVMATWTLMLANWPSIFGWDSWGARYLVPVGLMVLTSACLTLDAAAPAAAVERAGERPRVRHARAFAIGLVVCGVAALSLRYVAVGYRAAPSALFSRSLFSQPACVALVAAINAQSPDLAGYRFWKSDLLWNCYKARFRTDPVPLAAVGDP